MTDYSATARRNVRDLIAHYGKKRRPEAIRNLLAALQKAEIVIADGPRRPRSFPANYRDLVRPGRAWIKVVPYWIAYDLAVPRVIVGVFWESADLVRRYPVA